MEYYSEIKKNEFESVLVRQINLEPVIEREVSQRKTNIVHQCMCMEPRKVILMNLFARRNGDTDAEKRLVDTAREGATGSDGESSISISILSGVGWRAGEDLVCGTGSPFCVL